MRKAFFILICCGMTYVNGISQENLSLEKASGGAKAFSHLGVSLELLSTTGIGAELSTPLSSNFTLRGGISLLPYNYKDKFSVNRDEDAFSQLDNVMSQPDIKSQLEKEGLPTRSSEISSDVDIKAKLKMFNGKILVDYHPWADRSFHLTAGLYIGRDKWITTTGKMEQIVEILDVLKANGYSNYENQVLYEGEGGDYELKGSDIRNINASFEANAVKPYLGIGFGRAIPKKRIGVAFDLGVFYHGKAKLTSTNENIQKMIESELKGVNETLEKIPIYPVVSLRLTGRIL